MQLLSGIAELKQSLEQSIITIGNFDGLHLGHRTIIEKIVNRAKLTAATSVVFTFNPHPLEILDPHRDFKRLFDFNDLTSQLRQTQVDMVIIEPFSREFSRLSPEHFLKQWIIQPLKPKLMIVGYDFKFGFDGTGNLEFLRRCLNKYGVELEVVPPLCCDDIIVSSTQIRQAVNSGDVILARKMLGRPFYLKGIVEKGDQRGRTIGFPTANLHTNATLLPLCGVYATQTSVRGHMWPSITNIGNRPTFYREKDGATKIETHLLDFYADIYGEEIIIEFCDFLRHERQFSGVEELITQINTDIKWRRTGLRPEPLADTDG